MPNMYELKKKIANSNQNNDSKIQYVNKTIANDEHKNERHGKKGQKESYKQTLDKEHYYKDKIHNNEQFQKFDRSKLLLEIDKNLTSCPCPCPNPSNNIKIASRKKNEKFMVTSKSPHSKSKGKELTGQLSVKNNNFQNFKQKEERKIMKLTITPTNQISNNATKLEQERGNRHPSKTKTVNKNKINKTRKIIKNEETSKKINFISFNKNISDNSNQNKTSQNDLIDMINSDIITTNNQATIINQTEPTNIIENTNHNMYNINSEKESARDSISFPKRYIYFASGYDPKTYCKNSIKDNDNNLLHNENVEKFFPPQSIDNNTYSSNRSSQNLENNNRIKSITTNYNIKCYDYIKTNMNNKKNKYNKVLCNYYEENKKTFLIQMIQLPGKYPIVKIPICKIIMRKNAQNRINL